MLHNFIYSKTLWGPQKFVFPLHFLLMFLLTVALCIHDYISERLVQYIYDYQAIVIPSAVVVTAAAVGSQLTAVAAAAVVVLKWA